MGGKQLNLTDSLGNTLRIDDYFVYNGTPYQIMGLRYKQENGRKELRVIYGKYDGYNFGAWIIKTCARKITKQQYDLLKAYEGKRQEWQSRT